MREDEKGNGEKWYGESHIWMELLRYAMHYTIQQGNNRGIKSEHQDGKEDNKKVRKASKRRSWRTTFLRGFTPLAAAVSALEVVSFSNTEGSPSSREYMLDFRMFTIPTLDTCCCVNRLTFSLLPCNTHSLEMSPKEDRLDFLCTISPWIKGKGWEGKGWGAKSSIKCSAVWCGVFWCGKVSQRSCVVSC